MMRDCTLIRDMKCSHTSPLHVHLKKSVRTVKNRDWFGSLCVRVCRKLNCVTSSCIQNVGEIGNGWYLNCYNESILGNFYILNTNILLKICENVANSGNNSFFLIKFRKKIILQRRILRFRFWQLEGVFSFL